MAAVGAARHRAKAGVAGSDWKAQAKALEKAMLEALNSK